MSDTDELLHRACYPVTISGWHFYGLMGVSIGWIFFLSAHKFSLGLRTLVALAGGAIAGWLQFLFHSWLRSGLIEGSNGMNILSLTMITLAFVGAVSIVFFPLGKLRDWIECRLSWRNREYCNAMFRPNLFWLAPLALLAIVTAASIIYLVPPLYIRLLFMRQFLWLNYALFGGFLAGNMYELYYLVKNTDISKWGLSTGETITRLFNIFIHMEATSAEFVGYNVPMLFTFLAFVVFFSFGPALAALYQALTCGAWPRW